MSDQPHSTPTSELPRSPRVQRLLDDPLDLRNGPGLTDPDEIPSVPMPDGDGASAVASADAHADPPPAATPDASAEDRPRDGGQAGAGRPSLDETPFEADERRTAALKAERSTSLVRDTRGRFTARPTIPAMSADLAQALLDADAEVWRVDNSLRTAGVLVFAVEFEDRVRNGGGAA